MADWTKWVKSICDFPDSARARAYVGGAIHCGREGYSDRQTARFRIAPGTGE